MPDIALPRRFEEQLKGNNQLLGVIYTVLAEFGQILDENNLYFFEEYTDHGVRHIQKVLYSSEHLMTTETDDIIGPKSITYYVLTVILHDIGMHLRPEGFSRLINGEYDSIRITDLDHKTWAQLWGEYREEARRFNDKQLIAIFGGQDFVVTAPDFSNPDKLNGSDRKLIGEFIRRHHPRLAHETALHGFPGSNIMKFATGLSLQDRDLIGFIARSHGMGLRASADHLQTMFDKRAAKVPLGVHAVYLMILLRLADYLQIESDRTSVILLGLRTLNSVLSQKEHAAHLAVNHVDHDYQDDSERIFVDATPKTSELFFKLKTLIDSIQYEFDQSWSVLGELYGKVDKKPAIRFRRMMSNLDDPNFVNKLDYVADVFKIQANDELVKLLIAPLYGDDPSYGIRELLQNALDACRERETVEPDSFVYDPEVKIALERKDDQYIVCITDNGIGMDTQVIKEFFLRAGASFRNSHTWRKLFERTDGKHKVRRSGRFGIGVLAAFLIGSEIEVRTRKLTALTGFSFRASMTAEIIDVKKDATIPVGTQIVIQTTREIYNRLMSVQKTKSSTIRWFDWYTLNRPKVIYEFNGEVISIDRYNPDAGDDLPLNWHTLESDGYDHILWSYDSKANPAKLTCNGIIVPQDPGNNGLRFGALTHLPKISVFDSKGNFPLTLNRNAYSNKFTFAEDLERDVYKDFIAYLLNVNIRSKITDKSLQLVKQRLNYNGLLNQASVEGFSYGALAYTTTVMQSLLCYPLLGKLGFLLDYSYCVRKVRPKGLFIQNDGKELSIKGLDIQDRFIKYSTYSLETNIEYKAVIEPKQSTQSTARAMFFLKKTTYDHLFDDEIRRLSKSFKRSTKEIYRDENWVVMNVQLPWQPIISQTFLKEHADQINLIREYEMEPATKGNLVFNDLLERYLGRDPVIPYSMEKRRTKFPLAFEELAGYMKKYE
ncbi:MAG: HD domain-containing protein [Mucilaginibacter sp.]